MKKNNLTGWKEICSFTIAQTLKGKAYRVSLIIFLLLAILSIPVGTMFFNQTSNNDVKNEITNVYVINETAYIDLDFTEATKGDYKSVVFTKATLKEKDSLLKQIDKEKTSMLLIMTSEDAVTSFDFIRPAKGKISAQNANELSSLIQNWFKEYRMTLIGAAKDVTDLFNTGVSSKVTTVDMTGNEIVEEDTTINQNQYWLMYAIIMIVMMVNIMASVQVAASIVSDKSNRVVETLLISVKPMAIILGKIIAMLSVVLIQIVVLLIGGFLSYRVTNTYLFPDKADIVKTILPAGAFDNISAANIILCLILLSIGFIFFAMIAGLFGSMASKMEQLNDAMGAFTLITVISVYIAFLGMAVLQSKGICGALYFVYYFPLSSVYILPGAVLVGKASVMTIVIASALLVLATILLTKFVANVYEVLILYNGSKLKIKDLFRISKQVRGAKVENK